MILGGFESQAGEKGMDPSLISSVLGILGGGSSESGSFDIGSMISIAQMLTQGGGNGGGAQGFLRYLVI